MKTNFTNYITKDPIEKIYYSNDLLSYASYISSDIFKEADYKEILKDFINARNEFKMMVESYVNGKKIDIKKFIDLGEQLEIVLYYDDPQILIPVNKKYIDEGQVKWILNDYKEFLNEIKNEDLPGPNHTGEIGTVGYFGGYIKNVNELNNDLKELYINSLNELERKTLNL